MNWLNTFLILATAYLVVFIEASFTPLRSWVGAQVELLPSLVVYVSLTRGLPTLAALSICGGLWFDSLSANPLGASVLPLFGVGWVIQRYKGLILRNEIFVQRLLGLAASAAVPLLTVLLLLNTDRKPLLGWFSLWQWLFVSLVGAIVTPLWFKVFDWLSKALSYRPLEETSFRLDREIKRGRR
jgi:hypothetical protein